MGQPWLCNHFSMSRFSLSSCNLYIPSSSCSCTSTMHCAILKDFHYKLPDNMSACPEDNHSYHATLTWSRQFGDGKNEKSSSVLRVGLGYQLKLPKEKIDHEPGLGLLIVREKISTYGSLDSPLSWRCENVSLHDHVDWHFHFSTLSLIFLLKLSFQDLSRVCGWIAWLVVGAIRPPAGRFNGNISVIYP